MILKQTHILLHLRQIAQQEAAHLAVRPTKHQEAQQARLLMRMEHRQQNAPIQDVITILHHPGIQIVVQHIQTVV